MEESSKALYNDLILYQVFSYMNIQDIKSCRLVNSYWSKIGWKRLNGVGKQKIYNPSCACLQITKPPKLLRSFVIMERGRDPECRCEWTVEGFAQVVDYYLKDVQQLQIKEMYINRNVSISLNNIHFKYLKTLKIDDGSMLNLINANCIAHVSELSLCNCALDLSLLEKKMSPIKLKLYFVNMTPQEKGNVFMNKFIDFGKTKKVVVYNIPYALIDLAECKNVLALKLFNVQIANGLQNNLKVQKLAFCLPSLKNFSFGPSAIKKCKAYISINNMSQLPTFVSALSLCLVADNLASGYKTLTFRYLEKLDIVGLFTNFDFNQVFTQIDAPKLKKLKLIFVNEFITLTSFPSTVDYLKLSSGRQIRCRFKIKVKVLILQYYELAQVKKVLKFVSAEKVVIRKPINDIALELSAITNINAPFVAIGPCVLQNYAVHGLKYIECVNGLPTICTYDEIKFQQMSKLSQADVTLPKNT